MDTPRRPVLSPLLLALVLASGQPPRDPSVVRGAVLRHDGSRVTGSWSLLVDPSRPPTIWDARVRLERAFTIGDVDLTIFGEAYSSYQGRASLQQALPPPLAKSLRTGTAGRVGVKVGFWGRVTMTHAFRVAWVRPTVVTT